jgi:putative hemolysin
MAGAICSLPMKLAIELNDDGGVIFTFSGPSLLRPSWPHGGAGRTLKRRDGASPTLTAGPGSGTPDTRKMTSNAEKDVDSGVRQSTGYRVRLAGSVADVRAAQFLRFAVFNLELREGLEAAYDTCLDADRFDAVCDHLLVENAATGDVVGTYRLQTGTAAARNLGYYSAQEFEFAPYEPLRAHLVELGRACIHADHRNFTVLNLLWKGIAQYAASHGAFHLIGCSSFSSQDPAVGAAAYLRFQKNLADAPFRTVPTAAFHCPMDTSPTEAPKIPKLLAAYLAVGAKICGPPALDREFKTIDFLTLMDLRRLSPRAMQRFFGVPAPDR